MARRKKPAGLDDIFKGLDSLVESTPLVEQEQEQEQEQVEIILEQEEPVIHKPTEEFSATAFGRNLTKMYLAEAGYLCAKCRFSYLEHVEAFSGRNCEFFVYCPTCNAYICTYKPMKHQEAFHLDDSFVKMYAGGFGSAKTYTCGMEFLSNVMQIPESAGLVGAATWGQVADTCLKFILDNVPKALVAKTNQNNVSWYMDLVNGSRISAKVLDKEGKIRSANLSIIWVEEASEVPFVVVSYIKARLRNKVAFHNGKNRLRMLLSTNPDVGWVNTEILQCSGQIHYHGDVVDRYVLDAARQDPATSTHISATSANEYLPPDYEKNLAKNKPQWWINRFLKGSFKYSEGLVYPDFMNWFVEPFEIPHHWRRVTGTDFGRRDPTAHLVAALDPVRHVIYIYAEIEEPLDDKPLSYMADKIKTLNSYSSTLLAFPHSCDPRGRNRDQVSGQSWINAFAEYGIYFATARDCESDSLAPTIQKFSDYAMHGRLKIFSNCRAFKDSLSKYKYPPRDLGDDSNQGEKPMDKNNHLPDAARYLLSPFPAFPNNPDDFSSMWIDMQRSFNSMHAKAADFWSTPSANEEYTDMMDDFGGGF